MRQGQNHTPHATAQAGLAMLIVLQLVMLMALFAGVPPHPPETIPLGGIAPILAAGFATAAGAMILGPTSSRLAQGLAIVAVAIAMLSFGPQKYLNGQLGLIWPAVIMGQISAVMVAWALVQGRTARHQTVAA